jgi:hypothetical protein
LHAEPQLASSLEPVHRPVHAASLQMTVAWLQALLSQMTEHG